MHPEGFKADTTGREVARNYTKQYILPGSGFISEVLDKENKGVGGAMIGMSHEKS